MKSFKEKLIVIDGCGDNLLDRVERLLSYECQGNGQILIHSENLNSDIPEIWEHLECRESATVSKNYYGFLLLRR